MRHLTEVAGHVLALPDVVDRTEGKCQNMANVFYSCERFGFQCFNALILTSAL